MFEILLSSKVPMEVNILNTKFLVSNSKKKLIKFDENRAFSVQYNFAGKNSVVYCADFVFENENLTTNNQNFKIVNYEPNKFLVEILQQNCVFLQKKIKKIKNNDAFYSFYQNGLVEIESQTEILFSEIYDFEILDAEILNLNNDFVAIKLFGESDEACIILNDKFIELDFFKNAIVEKTEQGFKVLIDIKDIARHGLVKEYQITETANLVDEYSVYLKGRPILPSNANVVPLFFAECIRAKDFSLAKNMLCDELKDSAKQEHLANFFGGFLSFDADCWTNEKNVLCFEYQKNNKKYIKKYTFALQNDKIVNIR